MKSMSMAKILLKSALFSQLKEKKDDNDTNASFESQAIKRENTPQKSGSGPSNKKGRGRHKPHGAVGNISVQPLSEQNPPAKI